MRDVREHVLGRLRLDLLGPITEDEIIEDRPSDRYLTGVLFPPGTPFGAEQDDDAEASLGEGGDGGGEEYEWEGEEEEAGG